MFFLTRAYGSFVSTPCAKQPPVAYIEALSKQLSLMADHPWAKEQVFGSIFLGGGTPTIYEAKEIANLVGKLCPPEIPVIPINDRS